MTTPVSHLESHSGTHIEPALADTLSPRRVRFHIPGHQGRKLYPAMGIDESYLAIDATEIDGLDDLSDPTGCIAHAQAHAATLYGVAHSFFLVQGSTVGLQAAILATFNPGQTIIVPRNVHRSIMHAMVLADLIPAWVMPTYSDEWGTWLALTEQQVVNAFDQYPNATGIILPSPTYDGWVAELHGIAKHCAKHNKRLIVDEAHGALFALHKSLPVSACQLPEDTPADVVVHSLHKHAGGISPSALAHIPYGSTVSPQRFQAALNLLHTSSPSYPLMSAMDAHLCWLASETGKQKLDETIHTVQQWHENTPWPKGIHPCTSGTEYRDPLSLLIRIAGHNPETWAVWVEEEEEVSFEALNTQSALYKIGLGLQPNDLTCLNKALHAWNTTARQSEPNSLHTDMPMVFNPSALPSPITALTPRQAFFSAGEIRPKQQCVGAIAKQTHAPCPPGISLVIPGEVIQQAHLPFLPQNCTVVQASGSSPPFGSKSTVAVGA